MTLDPNSTGSPTSKQVAEWVASHSGGGTGSGVPSGGTTGEVLVKESNADGDAGWADAAVASNSTPAAASGAGNPGVATDFSRSDHIHPASSSSPVIDAYTIVCANPVVANDIYATGYSSSTLSLFSDTRGQGFPIRFTQAGTFKLGLLISATGAASSVCRIGLFNDDAGGYKAGTLLADLGTVDTNAATGAVYTSSSHAVSATARYWVVVTGQGGAVSQPSLQCTPIQISVYNTLVAGAPAATLRYTISGAYSSTPSVTSADVNPPFLILAKAV